MVQLWNSVLVYIARLLHQPDVILIDDKCLSMHACGVHQPLLLPCSCVRPRNGAAVHEPGRSVVWAAVLYASRYNIILAHTMSQLMCNV